MNRNDNVTFLVAHFQSNLRSKQNKVRQNISGNSNSDIFNKKNTENRNRNSDAFDFLSPGEIETISDMSYLLRLTKSRKQDVVIDPVSRLKSQTTSYKYDTSNIKSKLRCITESDELNASNKDKNYKRLNKILKFPQKNKSVISDTIRSNDDFSLVNKNLNTNNKDNIDKNTKSTQNSLPNNPSKNTNLCFETKNEKSEYGYRMLTSPNVSSYMDTMSYKKAVIFQPLSAILLEFPDDIDPNNFFTQHSIVLAAFSDYIKENYNGNAIFQTTYITNKHGITFKGFEIKLTDLINRDYMIRLPFSLSYLIISLPYIVQLCFINNYIANSLKTYKRIIDTFDLTIFIETLERLCGVETARTSIISVKSNIRKSQFVNANLNNIFGDKDESAGSRSQVISNFDEKFKSTSKNMNKWNKNANNSKLTREQSIAQDIKANEKTNMAGIYISELRTDYMPENQTMHQHSFKNIDYSRYKTDDRSIGLITENSKYDISSNDIASSKIDFTNNNNLNTSDESNISESSIDSTSLEEEKYISNNPYEIKYSKINYKFKSYTINMTKPCMWTKDNKINRTLAAKELEILFSKSVKYKKSFFDKITE